MFESLITVVFLSCSMYAPNSGDGISGGKTTASGFPVGNGMAACPYNIPFGTRAIVEVDLTPYGLPQDLECMDHMRQDYAYGHFDIALVFGPGPERIKMAKQFGRRRCRVTFVKADLNSVSRGKPLKLHQKIT